MKILLVEDNPGDAGLTKTLLKEAKGEKFEISYARRLSEAVDILNTSKIDIVLLDLGLPDSVGISTFSKIHDTAPKTPIVVLSGMHDEDVAIRTVQQGAQDYLIKGEINSDILYRVIRYAVERQQAGEALRESEMRYRLLAENVSDVIWMMDLDLSYKYISPSIEQLQGFTPEEYIKMRPWDHVSKGSLEVAKERLIYEIEMEKTGVPDPERVITLELELERKDGTWVWVESKISFLRDNDGKAIGLLGVSRDVSERRRMEETLRETSEKLRVLFDSIGEAVTLVDMSGNIVDANKEALRLHNFERKDEILGLKASEMVAPIDRDKAMKDSLNALKSSQPSGRNEYRLITRAGREFDGEFNVAIVRDNRGRPAGFVGIARDISERKRVLEALRQSQETLRAVFDAIGDVVIVTNLEGRITDANSSLTNVFRYERKDVVGKVAFELMAPEYRETAINEMTRSLSEDFVGRYREYKLIASDGRLVDCEVVTSKMNDSAGNLQGFVGVIRDVTQRKKMEETLRNSEEKLRITFNSARDGIAVVDLLGVLTEVNSAILNITGYSRDELIGKSPLKFVVEEDQKIVIDSMAGTIAAQNAVLETLTLNMIRKDGSIFAGEMACDAVKDKQGNVAGFVAILKDVTERKRLETQLRESERKLRTVFDSITDGLVITDLMGTITDTSEAALRIGQRGGDEDCRGMKGQDFLSGGDRKNVEKIVVDAIKDPKRLHSDFFEYTATNKDGTPFYGESSITPMRDNNGKPIGIVFVTRDISARKRMEEALRTSEEKLRVMFNSMMDGVVLSDANINIVDVNKATLEMLGVETKEGLIGRNAMDVIRLKEPGKAIANFTRMFKEGRSQDKVEYGLTLEDGREMDVEVSTALMRDSAGNIVGFVNAIRDVSERKKAEDALRKSEEKYRNLVEQEKDVIVSVDALGYITSVNSSVITWGYTVEEVLKMNFLELVAPAWRETTAKDMQARLLEKGENIGETVVMRKDGEERPIEYSAVVIWDRGEYAGAQAIVRDISERKRAEEKIKNHSRRIEALYSVAQVVSQSSTVGKMLSDSLEKVCSAMDTESGCILMLDMDENALKLTACRGVPKALRQQFATIGLTEDGIEELMNLSEPITNIDGTQITIEPEKMKKVTADLGRKGIAAAPFFRGKDFQGVLVVFSSEERIFNVEDLDMFKAMANEISIGMNNMMLLEKTREMSVTDELTGLYNRRYFFEMLDVEMNRAGRTKHPFSVVMLDLDGFKEYNDKYGHSNGDAVLANFSQVLKASVRRSDLAFRYGGDEFALILPGADSEKAKKIVQRARAKWQKTPLKQTSIFGVHVGFSGGIAEYPTNAESPDGLVFLADAALYQAKKKGFEDKIVSELRTLSTDIIDVATQDQIYALAATVDARDPYTYGHSQRVADAAMSIGQAIGMSVEDLSKLHAAALLHDIGKVGVPDAILTKMGKPTPEEWDVVKKHCAEGARILGYVKELATLVPIVLHHHEWYDGSGYPSGLRGLDIPSGARITSVADAYDTMVTKRPYRDAITPKEACEELRRNAGTQFDPVIVDVWCGIIEGEGRKGA